MHTSNLCSKFHISEIIYFTVELEIDFTVKLLLCIKFCCTEKKLR